jgi:Phosphate transporter family
MGQRHTTHTVTGAVIGVGAARKVSAVRWNIAANIVIAWIVTLPASGSWPRFVTLWSGFFHASGRSDSKGQLVLDLDTRLTRFQHPCSVVLCRKTRCLKA